jgi:oligopeptidase B
VYTAVASSSLGCVGANQMFDADEIFVSYMSLTTPKTVYRYNMRTGDKKVVKVTPVNGFDADKYDTMRTQVGRRLLNSAEP